MASACLALLLMTLAACAQSDRDAAAGPETSRAAGIAATAAWLRFAPGQPESAAGYVVLTNHTDQADRLIGADADGFARIAIRGASSADDASGLVVPAGGTIVLAPRAQHLAFRDATSALAPAGYSHATLQFANAGDLRVAFVHRPVAAHLPADARADLQR